MPEPEWKVGDRVRNIPAIAHIYPGAWGNKLARQREGTVIKVPWHAAHYGHGTLLVQWDSLTGEPADPADWQRWMHSENVERVDGAS